MSTSSYDETVSGITCDLQGNVTNFGIGASKIFGWTSDEVVGKQNVAIFHTPENISTLVPELLKIAAETGEWSDKITLVRKNGERFEGLLTVRPLRENNEMIGFIGVTKEA